MIYNPEKKDYSTPYKTFNDLKEGDKIFIINFNELKVVDYFIKDYEKKESRDFYRINCFEVEFKLPDFYEYDRVRIHNGNTMIYKVNFNYKDLYICTDKRIADTIIDLLHSRNTYQWQSFSEIFGHPLAGKFEPRHVVLR